MNTETVRQIQTEDSTRNISSVVLLAIFTDENLQFLFPYTSYLSNNMVVFVRVITCVKRDVFKSTRKINAKGKKEKIC